MKFISALFFAAAAVAPAAADTGKTEPVSIIDLAAADGKYGTLLSAVTNTPGVLDAVAANFPVTIFGPVDAAFAAIQSTVEALTSEELAGILAGHVVSGVFTAQMVIDAGCVELQTLAGNQVRVMVSGGSVMVNDATVIQPDIIGEGGVIHGIDKVILPGTFRPCPADRPVAAPVAPAPVSAPVEPAPVAPPPVAPAPVAPAPVAPVAPVPQPPVPQPVAIVPVAPAPVGAPGSGGGAVSPPVGVPGGAIIGPPVGRVGTAGVGIRDPVIDLGDMGDMGSTTGGKGGKGSKKTSSGKAGGKGSKKVSSGKAGKGSRRV